MLTYINELMKYNKTCILKNDPYPVFICENNLNIQN